MYRVSKDKGLSNITIENTELKAKTIIGRPTITILGILSEAGYSPSATEESKRIDVSDTWNFEVPEEVAKRLKSEAFKMEKPIRVKKETEADAVTKAKKNGQPVDVFDLIFGIKD